MRDALTGLPDEEDNALAELKDRRDRQHDVTDAPTVDAGDVRILDDSPLTERPYRLGDIFDLYDTGTGTKYKVTEIVERDDRRITYGTPA